MPRRGQVIRRETAPDPRYQSVTVANVINRIMIGGKKSLARKIVYDALNMVEGRVNRDPVDTLEQAIKNATPLIQVKARRVGGATYQVPVEVRHNRALFLATRWLVLSARGRTGRSMAEKLAAEILDASQRQGAAVKKREDTHRMAEANKAFAHYRW